MNSNRLHDRCRCVCFRLIVCELAEMAPQTRRMAFPRVVIERDTDTEQSSSEDEEEDREEGPFSESEEEVTENGREEKIEEDLDAKRKGKAPITISLKKVCKVSPFKKKTEFLFSYFYSNYMFWWGFRFVKSRVMKQDLKEQHILIVQ